MGLFEAGDFDFCDVLFHNQLATIPSNRKRTWEKTYRHTEISMHQRLKLPRHIPFIPNHQTRAQIAASQSNTVDQSKLRRPGLPALLTQIAGAEPKIQLHAIVPAAGNRGGFGGRLAQEFPARRAREAVLRELGRCCVIRRCAEDLDITLLSACALFHPSLPHPLQIPIQPLSRLPLQTQKMNCLQEIQQEHHP